MVQVRWSQEAENDLDEYCAYIARTSSGSQAGLFAGRIHAVVESIRLLPYSGWVVPKYGDAAIRERLSGNPSRIREQPNRFDDSVNSAREQSRLRSR